MPFIDVSTPRRLRFDAFSPRDIFFICHFAGEFLLLLSRLLFFHTPLDAAADILLRLRLRRFISFFFYFAAEPRR